MKSLKNLFMFLAGGITVMYLIEKGCIRDAQYPREGTVMFEDDKIKVVRCSSTAAKNGVDLAVVVNKDKAKF